MPSYETLEQAYREKRAAIPVDRANHREFVLDGLRYFCCWDSRRESMGWHVYKSEHEHENDFSSILVAVEFGYRCAEKGKNLQQTLTEAQAIAKGERICE